jgi:hypothetical protein
MALSNKERQAKHRKKLLAVGVHSCTLPWPCDHQAELRVLATHLIDNPDCSFVPCYRDARGRLYTLRENRG